MRNLFQFRKPPPFGKRVSYRGHPFVFGGAETYTRRDGQASYILTWVSICERKNCDLMYYQTTGLIAGSFSKRCPFHRRGTKEQKARRIMKILQDYFATPPAR